MGRVLAILAGTLGGLLLLAAALVLALSLPPGGEMVSRPRPAGSYDEAVARFDSLERAEPADVNPVCRSRLLAHGRRTGRAIVLLHGFTNCPRQFEALGEMLFERGANVLIVRAPHHGLRDVFTRDPQRLTRDELAAFGDETADIARGLGDSVTVAGLSMGANVAAWLAEKRSDVDRAVLIAPLFGIAPVWPPVTAAVARGLTECPDQCVWWDPRTRERVGGPPYAYPRFSTRALGQALLLGLSVAEEAGRIAPRARSILVVTVGGDPAVRNDVAARVQKAWSLRAPGRVEGYEFPATLGLGHDLVDPLQPYQKVDRVYPVLAEMMWPK